MIAGGVTVPAYTTNTANDHAFIFSHSEASMVICSTKKLAKNVIEAAKQTPNIRHMIFLEPLDGLDIGGISISSWDGALKLGAESPDVDFTASLKPDDLACFIYTSGTGGQPKGVMLSHRNITANIDGAFDLLADLPKSPNNEPEVFLSFLPLSHSYEHTGGQFLPISMGAQIYYAEGVDSLSTNLGEARPTIMTCVPRLYEVLRQKIVSGVDRAGGLKAKLFHQAIALGTKRYEKGGNLAPWEIPYDRVLDSLVRKKVAERFGGRLKAMVSGGAPLNYEVGLFFVSLGMPVLQGYGQTEAAPVISANPPGRARLDTVGPPFRGVDVEIAEDGEILVRGDNVMLGYWKDQENTENTVKDGWLHTGDVGHLDENGFLKITDRKKDLIVNSGGDNISPQRVEGVLLLEPEIAQVLVYGDKKPFLVALIVPDEAFVVQFGREHKKPPKLENLVSDRVFRQAINDAIKRANKNLSAIERIRKFEVMAEPFSVENGLMTPTLKPRRPIIVDRFGEKLEALYGSGKQPKAE